jgi:small-conductance mechanosensitive channel
MNASALTTFSLPEFIAALTHPSAWVEGLVALACLGLAALVVLLLRRQFADDKSHSIWLGRKIYDGALFPTLSFALSLLARRIMVELGLPLAIFKLVVPVLLSFAAIRLSVRVLGLLFPASRLVRAAERTISWLAWLGVVGWITGVLPKVLDDLDQIQWKLGAATVSVRSLLEGAVWAGVVLMVALWISAEIEVRLLRGMSGEQLSLRKAAANAVRAVLTLVGLLLAASAAGIDLTALSVLGGAIGVGLGFGLQKLAANYVSGFVILAERSVRIGDYVRIAGFEGRISDITTRYTVVRSLGGTEAVVPNETLLTTMVENLSLADTSVVVSTTVSVAYGTDVLALREKIAQAVLRVERVLSDPAPAAHLVAFGPDGLELGIYFWIGDPENGMANVRSAVNLAILGLFTASGVEIPYAQRVFRLDPGSLKAWAAATAASGADANAPLPPQAQL